VKLDYPALEGTGIEGVTYTLGLGKIGSFAFNVPAGSATAVAIRQAVDGTFSPSEKAPIVVWIYDSTEGLVFKGKIDAASYTTTADGKKMLAVAGPSVAIELQQRTVGLGLQWEDVAFSTAVSDILDDTDWSAGELDSAVNVPRGEWTRGRSGTRSLRWRTSTRCSFGKTTSTPRLISERSGNRLGCS
jgi:hypothetical protein